MPNHFHAIIIIERPDMESRADIESARMIDTVFNQTIKQYPYVECSKYVIMPNHFHAIIIIERPDMESRADIESAPTVSEIVQSFKRHSTIEYINLVKQGLLSPFEKHIWQRSFYDHIIRNDKDYQKIWEYIDTSLMKWEQDCFYINT